MTELMTTNALHSISRAEKTMIGGGFIAGSILAVAGSTCRRLVICFTLNTLEYDQHRRVPKPGTEFLSLLKTRMTCTMFRAFMKLKTL